MYNPFIPIIVYKFRKDVIYAMAYRRNICLGCTKLQEPSKNEANIKRTRKKHQRNNSIRQSAIHYSLNTKNARCENYVNC